MEQERHDAARRKIEERREAARLKEENRKAEIARKKAEGIEARERQAAAKRQQQEDAKRKVEEQRQATRQKEEQAKAEIERKKVEAIEAAKRAERARQLAAEIEAKRKAEEAETKRKLAVEAKAAAEKAAADRMAAAKATADKAATDKAAAMKAVADKATADRLAAKAAADRAEADRLMAKAAADKAAAEKMVAKAAADRAEAERLAAAKAALQKTAADKAAAEKSAAADKLAAAKAASDKVQADKTTAKIEADRKAAEAKLAADKAAADKKAAFVPSAPTPVAANQAPARQSLWPRMGVPTTTNLLALNKDKLKYDYVSLQLASAAYSDGLSLGSNVFKGNSDWKVLDRRDNKSTGFTAFTFVNIKEHRMVVAVRGSASPVCLVVAAVCPADKVRDAAADWIGNADAMIAGRISPQFLNAEQYVSDVKKKFGDRFTIDCSGHSQAGGACAYAASQISDIHAVTINPTTSNSLKTDNAYMIDNYVVGGEVALGGRQFMDKGLTGWSYKVEASGAPGPLTTSNANSTVPVADPLGSNTIARHSPSGVIEVIGKEIGLAPFELAQ